MTFFIMLKTTEVRKKQVNGIETVPPMAFYPSYAIYSICAQQLLGLSEVTESSMLVHHFSQKARKIQALKLSDPTSSPAFKMKQFFALRVLVNKFYSAFNLNLSCIAGELQAFRI